MCSVIGALIQNPTAKDFESIRKVFLESKIRGMHATGLSYIKDGRITTFKESVPADKFVHLDNLEEMVNDDGNLYLIGHCRYSTSDLLYNQPIASETHSIVHNGVITQELPENWGKLFHYPCETKNDSELVLHSANALGEYPDASMAVCELSVNDKHLVVFRNGKRPLYLTSLVNGVIITSTADIPKRAGIRIPAVEVPMNTYLTFDSNMTMNVNLVKTNKPDLQKVDYETETISN
jgi:glutamine phosphoribosylpyrophosphate amidotransferase